MREKVKQLCREQGKTLAELANDIGILPESMSRAIGGNPRLSTIQNIAKALHVPVAELFTNPEGEGELYGFMVVKGKPVQIRSVEDLERCIQGVKHSL